MADDIQRHLSVFGMKLVRAFILAVSVTLPAILIVLVVVPPLVNQPAEVSGRIMAGSVSSLSRQTIVIFTQGSTKLSAQDGEYVTLSVYCERSEMAEAKESDLILAKFSADTNGLPGSYIVRIGVVDSGGQYRCSTVRIDWLSLSRSQNGLAIDMLIQNSAPVMVDVLYSIDPEIVTTWSRIDAGAREILYLYAYPLPDALLSMRQVDASSSWRNVEILVDPQSQSVARRIAWAQEIFETAASRFAIEESKFLWNITRLDEAGLYSVSSSFESSHRLSAGIRVFAFPTGSYSISVGQERIVAAFGMPVGLYSDGKILAGRVEISLQET